MTRIKAVVFDAYGTLFDVHSVIALCDELFPGNGPAISQLWRTRQLEYTWLRSLMGRYEDFGVVTRGALAFACATLNLPLTGRETDALLAAYNRLALFAEARAALDRLSNHKLAILSNGSPALLEPLVRNAGLDTVMSAVLSVDEVRVYKPHPRVYQLALDRLNVAKDEVAFVSSNYWDAAGAKSFGFRVYWVNRGGVIPDPLSATPDAVLTSLTELAGYLN
jgi:2-haloacid dehalogenase